jgi:PhoD-like phosphatase
VRSRRPVNRLRLGPVVGHTDEASARVWIQVLDDPSRYALRVEGAGIFPFQSTEGGVLEFRTAIAVAAGLRPEWQYRYSVLRLGRRIPGGGGSFRTMPPPGSMANVLFCPISCNAIDKGLGAWKPFSEFVDRSLPNFILMVGDQLYMDEDKPDTFEEELESSSARRRETMAEKYRLNWSRDPVNRILANVPTYMMWDDHDIRDGWGSSPADGLTLVTKYPRGQALHDTLNAYFEDARDVYWHFQGCHNPLPGDIADPAFPNYISGPPLHGQRRAMPFAFRCGRLAVLVVDSRGERDAFRDELPVLGTEQWAFVDHVLTNLPADVEALVVATPTPIASIDPSGQVMKLFGDRTDDIEAFKQGRPPPKSEDTTADKIAVLVNAPLSRLTGTQLNLGKFKISNLDETRDQWSHKFSRREQVDLIRKAGKARLVNRTAGAARSLIFVSGDIHVGCIFDLSVLVPPFKAVSLTSSGISNTEGEVLVVGTFVDESFSLGFGIHSKLREVVPDFNFGVVQVIPTGGGAEINGAVAHEGNAFAAGLDLSDLL